MKIQSTLSGVQAVPEDVAIFRRIVERVYLPLWEGAHRDFMRDRKKRAFTARKNHLVALIARYFYSLNL